MTNPVQNYFTKKDGRTLRRLPGNHEYIEQFRRALLVFGVVLPLVLFCVLASHISKGGFFAIERTFLWSLRMYATPVLDRAASVISMLVTFSSISMLCYLIYRRLWRTALFWLTAIAGAAILSSVLKSAIQRSRPDLWTIHASFGFPSGHATQSMAIAIALLILLRAHRRISTIAIAGMGAVLLVGICRMYLGFHYPADILAGWMLSLAWVSMLSMLFDTRYLTLYRMPASPKSVASSHSFDTASPQ